MPHCSAMPCARATVPDTDRGGRRAGRARPVLIATFLAFVVGLLSLMIGYSPDAASAATNCDKFAATNGSDRASGTRSAPFRTAQKLVDSLSAGQVGCLRKGVYTDGDKQVSFKHGGNRGDRIKLRSYPGERARFRGSIHIPEGSNFVTVRGMRLNGSYGPVGEGHRNKGVPKGDRNTEQAVRVLGDNVNVRDNNITNRRPSGNPDLAGTCIILGSSKIPAANTSIEGNRIHHCGQLPRINREHGIYASDARDATITDNLIYDNADRGIQLYPNARGTLVAGNIVNGNGENLVINENSSQNTIRNNVFSTPRAGWNIYSGRKATGSGNFVQRNCLWTQNGTSGIRRDESVFVARDNVVADPGFSGGDLTLARNSLCRSVYQGNG